MTTCRSVLIGWIALCCLSACGGISYAAEDDPVIDEKPLSQLIKQLRSDNRGFQLRAAQALAKAPAELYPKIVPSLIPLLHQSECWSTNMREVPDAIGLIGAINDNIVPNLIDAYEGSQYPGSWLPFKEAIMGALERFGPKSAGAVPFIHRQLRVSGNGLPVSLRTAIMKTLAAIGPGAKEALPEIEKQLGSLGDEAAKAYKAVAGQEPPAAPGKK